jgi:hypothetical protein
VGSTGIVPGRGAPNILHSLSNAQSNELPALINIPQDLTLDSAAASITSWIHEYNLIDKTGLWGKSYLLLPAV